MGRFEGKSIIVTGSSSGIGQSALVAFAKEGAFVTVHGTNSERIEKTRQLLAEASIDESKILIIEGSIEKEETVQNLISKTLEKFGKIDVLVNNAGISNAAGKDPSSIENFDQVMAVNVRAPFRLIELALPHLKETKGNIINVSSVAALMTPMNNPMMTAYGMSKAALDRMTQVQALQFAPFGVRVNNINPGPFETNISARNNLQMDDAHREIGKKLTAKLTPLGRSADPKELNEVFLLLADSVTGGFITGACWVVDGGMSINAINPADLKM
jgi:NAD(P)-dependent dehydrogenase (short-subunit alcohol dehydrogenase family)